MKSSLLAVCICLLVTIDWSVSHSQPDNLTLELVQVIFRHGERTLEKDEKKLITNTKVAFEKLDSFGQLTNKGKKQEYDLGRMLRRRYDDFLGKTYHPDNLYACSSDYDRTKVSLQLVLAGLYPPTPELRWHQNLAWQPIPTQYLPRRLDNIFLLSNCPQFKEKYVELMDSEEMRARLKEFDDLFKFLSTHYPGRIGLEMIYCINNILTIHKDFGIPFPVWYTPKLHEEIKVAAKFLFDTLSYTPDLIRLNAGGLTRRLAKNLDRDDSDDEVYGHGRRKMYLFSGHDLTVYVVLRAHNITLPNILIPDFGSALVLEQWHDSQFHSFVKMYFWTGSSKEMIPIGPNKCNDYCPIGQYLKIVEPSMPSDDEMQCLKKNLDMKNLDLFERLSQ
ncbi:hypothetical protein QAD02_017476 [Eretmocerus hayati]|uniref:Uncharacterized protein n=1 Tax=Eretmocerus hayati TaxID=131215 RepID=A0ACC2PDL8_9HYME|nr:hypothetical protein QAD02_017476 [Eretmocerus hayati]